ncbi:hypothetical protein [Marinobacter zhejiangensis]|uniref:Amino acid transport protein n=1 Tax=Marinobacter zhejiangensis TaxID=488535 RepID=A0A1I4RDT1_9GAMM|nr:hypothetical protein [Marinobacter zhejiangensis]SFM50367.1 hypothetical protein SAMN04487963_2704 [Marinobacter zhejiangensis]
MDIYQLVVAVLFGSIGLGYFVYGVRQSNLGFRLTGVALLIYPYFFDSIWTLLAIGVGLLLVPRFIDL